MSAIKTKPSGPGPATPARPSNWISSRVDAILAQPVAVWLLLAFLAAFALTFLRNTFLDEEVIQIYTSFPAVNPIGEDLRANLEFPRALLATGNPYTVRDNLYPPLATLFYLPLSSLPFLQGYNLTTIENYICFAVLMVGFPLLYSRERKLSPTLVLLLVAGLFSYPFLFQLERGQDDLVVALVLFTSVYLYHRQPRLRWLAYALFVISVQLKVYPLIFIITFVSDWSDWWGNLRRWALLLLANAAGLLVLGPTPALGFLSHITAEMANPTYNWSGNHSTHSFVGELLKELRPQMPGEDSLVGPLQYALFCVYFLFLGLIWLRAYRRRLSAANPYLVLACAIGMLVIPSTSHDYKLAILLAPAACFLNSLDLDTPGPRSWRVVQAGLIFLISFSLCYTLFLHDEHTIWLNSNYPALMLILIGAALLMTVRARLLDRSGQPSSFPDLA
ncbi:MAG TPA: glycosyltransferase family 87 protein [Anaerolineaceae bacterium]|nr:glycosyltransferase family 87 protein [Anaerolineaceae bacterium]